MHEHPLPASLVSSSPAWLSLPVTSRPPRYQLLAESLMQALRTGRYRPGERLPSVRDLCQEHGLSLATVTHALHRLEDAGWIESRARQGFYARTPQGAAMALGETASNSALALEGRRQRLMALAASTDDHLSLSHLALPPALLPVAALRRLMGRHLSREPALLASGTVFGSADLRQQLAAWLRRSGIPANADDVTVTHGDGESLQLCLGLLARPGDRVAVACPGSLRVLEMIAALGLHAVELPDLLAPDALPAFLARERPVACVVDTSLMAVAAGTMSDADRETWVAALAAHQVPLVECDLMGELHRGVARARPLKSFDRGDNVIYCGSLACITGPGYSVGYVVSGRRRLQLRAARSVHGELIPQLTDRVLASFLSEAAFDAHLRRLRRRLREQVAAWTQAVAEHFPAGTRVSAGEVGHVLWVSLPEGLEAAALLAEVRAGGYTFVPGAVFSTTGRFEHCLRLTAGHPLDGVRSAGLRLLAEAARRHMVAAG